jgi:ATPase subunit of ABC transporter with duplicated ATPase domains
VPPLTFLGSRTSSASSVSAISLTDVGFAWPDGVVALSGISATFGRGRTGLIGLNGSGKSTLLRLIRGELAPTMGSITPSGEVDYLPQSITLDTESTAADLLGIRAKLDALRAIESGDASSHNFELVGDDWDIEMLAGEAMRTAGLTVADLDRPVLALSGGETILVAIAGLRLRSAPIVLLDEPSNNLDRDARRRLADTITAWKGALVMVSHDVALLELMDDTAEIYAGQLTVFGGPYSELVGHLEAEQGAARQAQHVAEQIVKVEKRQRVETETKLTRRSQMGRKAFLEKRVPKIVANNRKSAAQVSAGKLRSEFDGKVRDARESLDAAERRVRSETLIHVDLPDPDVAAGRRLAQLTDGSREFVIQGPERVALIGPNGVGKTTLLEALAHPETARAGAGRATAIAHTDRIGYLTQRLDSLDGDASVLDNIRAAAPTVPPGLVRNRLPRFLIRGDSVERPVRGLSGGERFRVSLARLLLADPPPQLLVLDEPTNNLDLGSVDQLVSALTSYRGGLIVVSHDDAFLERLELTRWLELAPDGGLAEIPPR